MIFVKNTIYKKLFLTYTIVTIILIGSYNLYFIEYEKTTLTNQAIYTNKMLLEELNNKVNANYNFFNETILSLYSNLNIVEDLIVFLNNDLNTYLKFKLDTLSNNNKQYHNGIEKFVYRLFDVNQDLKEVSFVSNKRQEHTTINREKYIQVNRLSELNQDLLDASNRVITTPNKISFVREITNPLTLMIEGKIIFTFDTNNFEQLLLSHQTSQQEITMINEQGLIIYTNNKEYQSNYLQGYEQLLKNKEIIQKNKGTLTNIITNDLGFSIIGQINAKDINKLSVEYYLILILIDVLIFVFSQYIIYSRIKKMQNRLDVIVDTMKKVETEGAFVKIPTATERDELSYISDRFNDMCEKLEAYIKSSYLSEISQKNLEMQALQSKINPHFLYNTLECIRMKAICNDDREVSQMLYLLANLFRNQLKDNNIITLENEIEYCEKYIQLLKFRYPDQFDYSIEYPKEFLQQPIIKFILQPLIENYFVHGIRTEDSDNQLSIKVRVKSDIMIIIISDNGKGICLEKQLEINKALKEKDFKTNLMGILNVHQRITLVYGDIYGVSFNDTLNRGTQIELKIPIINDRGEINT